MRKITLPLVMIASFTALVSCGEKNTITPLVVIEQPSPTITGVVITTDTSKYNQDNFVKAVSAKAVGKKAKDFKVDAIGGSSLTTAAFETFVHSF